MFLYKWQMGVCFLAFLVLFSAMFFALTETDGLAIALLVTVLTSFGVIIMLLGCMLWNASRRDQDVDQLLDEMEKSEKDGESRAAEARAKGGRGEDKLEDWERAGDWWKKD